MLNLIVISACLACSGSHKICDLRKECLMNVEKAEVHCDDVSDFKYMCNVIGSRRELKNVLDIMRHQLSACL